MFEILYSSKNIKNSYLLYACVLRYYLEFIVVLYLLDKLETRNEKWEMRNEKREMRNEKWEMRNEKWEMRNERWEMITCPYNLLFLNFFLSTT